MNYSSLIGLAKETDKEKKKQPIKGFSTAVTPAKKPPRSNVPSAAVQAFLLKKDQQEKEKMVQARKEREKLLSLRAQNSKSNKAAKLMASRTKDNDFSRIRLTEDEVEANVKREAEIRRQVHCHVGRSLASRNTVYLNVASPVMSLSSPHVASPSRDPRVICDKVERMKTRIKLEEQEALLPHKRKRKPKPHDDDHYQNAPPLSPSPPPSPPRPPPNGIRKTKYPTQPNLSFADLMKIASVKQFEDPDEDVDDQEEYKPMTKSEKMQEEYRNYKMSVTKSLPDREAPKLGEVIERSPWAKMGKIPKKNAGTKSENSIPSYTSVNNSNRTPISSSVNQTSQGRDVKRTSDKRNENRTSQDRSSGNDFRGKSASKSSSSASQASERKTVDRSSQEGSRAFEDRNKNSVVKSVTRSFNERDSNRVLVDRSRNSENKSVKRSLDESNSNLADRNNAIGQSSQNRSNSRPVVDDRNASKYPERKDVIWPAKSVHQSSEKKVFRPPENMKEKKVLEYKKKIEGQSHSKLPNNKTTLGIHKSKMSSGNSDVKQRNLDQVSRMAEEFDNHREHQPRQPDARHESAFKNSLPAKKPRLDLQPTSRPQVKPSSYSRQGEIKERPHQENGLSKVSKSKLEVYRSDSDLRKESFESQKNRKREINPNLNKSAPQSRDPPAKSIRPNANLTDARRTKDSRVSLNDKWLEDDSGEVSQSNRFQDVRKKLVHSGEPQNSSSKTHQRNTDVQRIHANGRHVEEKNRQEDRRPIQQGLKSLDRRQQDRRAESKDEGRRLEERSQERRPVQNEPQRRPKDHRPEKRPYSTATIERESESCPAPALSKKSNSYGKSVQGGKPYSRKKLDDRRSFSGPTGSRRPLDTVYPAKSLARNPYNPYKPKLPPITSSRPKCPFMKSDSEDEEEEEEEYEEEDDDMDDFIDDGPQPDQEDYSKHIREIFGYDKSRYKHIDDDEAMESSFVQQMKEETRSRRLGILEDLEEEKKEEEARKRLKKRKNTPKKRV